MEDWVRKKNTNSNWIDIAVTKISDLDQKIIPLFNKYKLFGVKLQDFNYFCLAAEIYKTKGHLIAEGLEKIKAIKAKMANKVVESECEWKED